MYSYNTFPLIVKPIRVTEKSEFGQKKFDILSQHQQGVLLTSMSDNHCIFHITDSKRNESLGNENLCLKREMCHRNIAKSISEIQARLACFPFQKVKKKIITTSHG